MEAMTKNPFQQWLELQLELQVLAFNSDPRELCESPNLRAEFMIWNAFAAEDELHEAMQEIGWKPWASSRHLDDEAFLGEIVDALHFIGNMVLACAINRFETPEVLSKMLWMKYQEKVKVNIDRQREGYDGVKDKCPSCKRELIDRDNKKYCKIHGFTEGTP
jgi:hypothetical protein